jgi:hypothetical protein
MFRSLPSALLCATILLVPIISCGHQKFPEWRGVTPYHFPQAAWEASSIVAVGQMRNVSVYGVQTADRFPAPMSPLVHRLYWCVAEFDVAAVIKGERPFPAKRYVWAQVSPGCNLCASVLGSFQPIQIISFLLAHQRFVPSFSLAAVKRNFLLGSTRNFSLGRDNAAFFPAQ